MVALACGGVIVSCLSPTLPLPPPALPSITTQGVPAGQVKLTSVGGADPNAIIVIYNTDPNIPLDQRVGGAQADAMGSWDATVTAQPLDYLEISQQAGSQTSPFVEVQVPMQ
jgi:hypothetical protein